MRKNRVGLMPSERSAIQPVSRLKVADSVAAQLERLITQGEFEPGRKLPAERALADQFGVGRSSMREALRVVEAHGLVRIEHGVGVFVQDPHHDDAVQSRLLVFDKFTLPDLIEVRRALEPLAAGLAAKHLTDKLAERLTDLVDQSSQPGLSNDAFVELDALLHRTIAEASQNALLSWIYESIEPLFLAYSHRVIELPGRRSVAHCGHALIVEAIKGRRGREAREAAAQHIRDVERDVVEELARETAGRESRRPA